MAYPAAMKPLALIIENDGATRRLLDVLLSRLGYEVDAVTNAADALLLLSHVEYHAHFVDLLLPGSSGDEILRWLATHRRDALARCVVLSGASPAQLTNVADTWPVVRTIRKPFELAEITEVAQASEKGHVRRGDGMEEFTRASVRAGAKAGIILRARGNELVPVMNFGYSPGTIAAFLPMTLDKPYPLCIAYTHDRPVFLASVNAVAAEYPTLAPVWSMNESRSVAALPLSNGHAAIGAVGWSFREPRLFDEAEREIFLAIARNAAHAVHAGEAATASAS
jgi:CheY-like chemotaxis protein